MRYQHCCSGTRLSRLQTSKFPRLLIIFQLLNTFGRRFVDRVRRFCTGSDRKRAKYSARLLCYMKDKEDLRTEVVEVSTPFHRVKVPTMTGG